MNPAVDLEHEAQFGAIEVDDESADAMLPAELEAEHLAIPQKTPRSPLCGCCMAAQLAGSLDETELDRVAAGSHRTTVRARSACAGPDCWQRGPYFAFPLSRA